MRTDHRYGGIGTSTADRERTGGDATDTSVAIPRLEESVEEIAGGGSPGCGTRELLLDSAKRLDTKVGATGRIQGGTESAWHVGAVDHGTTLLDTRKVPALWLYQKQAVRKADRLHATAESEKQNLMKLGYNNRITVIANDYCGPKP